MGEKLDPLGEETGTQEERLSAAYSRKTTIHGLQYVLSPTISTIRRIIWGTVVFIFLIIFIYMLYARVAFYMTYSISTQTRTVLADKVLFPSVTICSQSPIKRTKVVKLQVKLPTTPGHWEDAISNTNLNISEVAVDAGAVLSNLVLSCQFGGTACALADWTASLTSLGRCFTLEPLSGQSTSGEHGGLRMVINSESYDVTYELDGAPGIKIFLHSAGDLPLFGENGISVQPGYDFAGQLSLHQSIGLPPPYSYCGVYVDGNLHSCRVECLIEDVARNCGCRPYYTNGTGYSVCTTSDDLNCSRSAINNFLATGSSEGYCNCHIPCTEKEFSVQTTFSPLPEATISKQLSSDTKSKITAAFNAAKALSAAQLPDALAYSDNIINVELFYKSMRYTEDIKLVAYNLDQLFSDIAFSFLICFGASVMSLYEFIDLAFVAIARRCQKNANVNDA